MQVKRIIATVALGMGVWMVPGVVLADTTVQNQNNCTNCVAASGPAVAANSSSVQSGPQAGSVFGSASAQQNGDNNTSVKQKSSAKSGDAVAGSQVTGVNGAGNTTIQNQNNATNAFAFSGPAIALNSSTVQSGPQAGSIFGSASAQQNGDNSTAVDQEASAVSGDAIAGSQITGVNSI